LEDISTFKAIQNQELGLETQHKICSTLIGLAIFAYIVAAADAWPFLGGCSIKGNISKNTGERIYHTPGQEYYSQTRIDLNSGERWFCSEADARAAGWRKSRS